MKQVFALRPWSIGYKKNKYYISPHGSKKWQGPYRTLKGAALAIAWRHIKEFHARHMRYLIHSPH